jgi:hypothetical protein
LIILSDRVIRRNAATHPRAPSTSNPSTRNHLPTTLEDKTDSLEIMEEAVATTVLGRPTVEGEIRAGPHMLEGEMGAATRTEVGEVVEEVGTTEGRVLKAEADLLMVVEGEMGAGPHMVEGVTGSRPHMVVGEMEVGVPMGVATETGSSSARPRSPEMTKTTTIRCVIFNYI